MDGHYAAAHAGGVTCTNFMEAPVKLKEEACSLANSILRSDENYLDNILNLWRIGEQLLGKVWDTEFHVFGVIASDTDHLPLSKIRKYCSETMLEKSDIELSEIIKSYKNDVIEACNEILTKHQNM